MSVDDSQPPDAGEDLEPPAVGQETGATEDDDIDAEEAVSLSIEKPRLSASDALQTPTIGVGSADNGRVALVQQFSLTVVEGEALGRSFTSRRDHAAIGTHKSADFILTDRTVSRFHCDISLADGLIVIRDLGSRNGTIVDGVAVQIAYLRNGSMIALGRTLLRFDIGRDHVEIPLSRKASFGLMAGHAPATRAAFAILERAADSDATVLIEGETGTGKELAAESIHMESKRREGPFIVVDCGSIPPDLLESELFGHEKGAFTGAVVARQGAFAAAHHGTVFLDEIGELSSELQPKILRVLERHQVKRVGANTYADVDVRVIAATNRNLRAEVNAQRFRSDLYYRLAVLEVRLPALRERLDDLPDLVTRILTLLGTESQPDAEFVRRPEFLASLRKHAWPGNVRELRNYIERCLAFRGEAPLLHHPQAEEGDLVDVGLSLKAAREKWTQSLERRYLEQLLKRYDDNVSAAARAAGVGRVYFYRLLWRNGLR
jgi:transcriptional regulator with AAA-type ATPase domain